jgi:RNA polymerase sigma-70 factor (ECF subfamily)
VKNYADQLFRFASLRINDKEVAKDLVQETFLSALRNEEAFKGEISEKNWLFTILKNKIIDHYRKKSSSLISQLEASNNESEYFDEENHWIKSRVPKEWQIDYNSTLDSNEFLEILQQCMKRLSELLKMVFAMKYLDERESDEICKELKITTSNYWVILHRSKLQLRDCIEKKWFIK